VHPSGWKPGRTETIRPPRPVRLDVISDELPSDLHRLLAAEGAAEAHGSAVDADDLRQSVRLLWLERARAGTPPPSAPAVWLRAAVRAQMRPVRRRARHEVPRGGGPRAAAGPPPPAPPPAPRGGPTPPPPAAPPDTRGVPVERGTGWS
jgi:hypothetical protein